MSRRTLAIALFTMFAILGVFLIGEEIAGPPEGPPPEDASPPRAGGHTVVPPEIGTASPPAPVPEEADERPLLVVITNVPGAEVTFRVLVIGGDPDPAPVLRIADGDGIARFAPPGDPDAVEEVRVEARAPGYRTAKGLLRDGRLQLTLTLLPGAAIRGRVVDGPDSPVPWAKLVIAEMPVQRAGPDGTFEVFAPDAGEVEMLVSTRGHLPAKVSVTAPAEDVLIELDRGLTISGQVTFPDGTPAPGVLVASELRQDQTGEDGRYEISGFVPEDTNEEVRCATTGERVRAAAGATGVDFVIEEHIVRVRVVDDQGRPFKRGSIWMIGLSEGEEFYTMGGGLGDGSAKQLDMPTGTELRIGPSAPGWAEEVTTVTITGEPRVHDIRIVMHRPPPPGAIELTVVDEDGKPLPIVYVNLSDEADRVVAGLRDEKVELDAEGRGRVEGVPAGTFTLSLNSVPHWYSLEGYGMPDKQEVRVPSGGVTSANSRVRSGGRIRVTVVNADGEVVAPMRVLLFDLEGERIYERFLHVDPDGSWSTDLKEPGPVMLPRPLPPGRYVVRVMRDDRGTEEYVAGEAETTVQRGATAEITIRLPR